MGKVALCVFVGFFGLFLGQWLSGIGYTCQFETEFASEGPVPKIVCKPRDTEVSTVIFFT
jgi:hypothetical protein